MTLYTHTLLPWLTEKICARPTFSAHRARIIPLVQGRVLEIGVGAGPNLPLYTPSQIQTFTGLDPSARALETARSKRLPFPTHFIQASGDHLPLADATMDAVVITYTLCTLPHPSRALEEIRRVLTPEGRLYFCEHGPSPHPLIHKCQHRLAPLWKPLAGGCRLNHDPLTLLHSAGFTLQQQRTPDPLRQSSNSFHYCGIARP